MIIKDLSQAYANGMPHAPNLTTPEVPGHLRPDVFDFPLHKILLGNGVLIMEHLFLEEVAGQRVELFIGALKVEGGDGAPARVLAVLDR